MSEHKLNIDDITREGVVNLVKDYIRDNKKDPDKWIMPEKIRDKIHTIGGHKDSPAVMFTKLLGFPIEIDDTVQQLVLV